MIDLSKVPTDVLEMALEIKERMLKEGDGNGKFRMDRKRSPIDNTG